MTSSIYDQLNGWGPDYDYWLALVARVSPSSLVDLGCGTGQLSVLFAQTGTPVLGVDPNPEMLAVARSRTGHDLVRWVDGYADAIPTASTDLITMTSHVAQVFLTDEDWIAALREMRRALRPGGRVAFDMRNLLARGWEPWNRAASLRSIETEDGPAEFWHEVTRVQDGLVTFDTITRLKATGVSSAVTDTLRFRDALDLERSLAGAGFSIEQLHGTWDGEDATAKSAELIVTAILQPSD